jgi:hypothetical protein
MLVREVTWAMAHPFLEFLKRFTGVSVPLFGLSWTPPPLERPAIVRLIAQLSDHRVLFDSGCGVLRRDMIDSSKLLREQITEAMAQIGDGSHGRPFLAEARRACQDFQSFIERKFNSDGYGGPEEDFYIALGELRAIVARSIVQLCELYGITVDSEVARIVENRAKSPQ